MQIKLIHSYQAMLLAVVVQICNILLRLLDCEHELITLAFQ